MAGYAFFMLVCLICVGCFVFWLGAVIYAIYKRRTRRAIILSFSGLLLILAVVIHGCRTVSSVSGSYQEKWDGRTTTLTLHTDGTFHQRFKDASGNIETSDGKWILHNGDFVDILFRHSMVTFDKTIIHSDSGVGSSDDGDDSNGGADVGQSSLCFGSNANDCLTR